MQWSDDIQIETPEQIDVALELAGLGSRFVAKMVDWVLKAAVLVVATLVGVLLLVLTGADVPAARNAVLIFLVVLFYFFRGQYSRLPGASCARGGCAAPCNNCGRRIGR